MSFEICNRDMLGRIGKLETKKGVIETPILLPVVNPAVQLVSPRTMRQEFDSKALITNAYILRKRAGIYSDRDIHETLDFDGVIMTDSGAYQILVYGNVDVTPMEIIEFQEKISTDVATILDIPTTWRTTKARAKESVDETLNRARQLAETKTRNDILWVAPIQGGLYLDLVEYSAKQVSSYPYQIHALGSPTTVMEGYRFDTLVHMIMAAKVNIPSQRPLHLFGAGHPFMFSFAVALGCDMFDSAAYAIYARKGRYMTEYGTSKLKDLEYFPCSCPVCSKNTPATIVEMPSQQREEALAKHNLHTSYTELKRVKQAITEGRLWEYLEIRAHSHPSLLQAAKQLAKYKGHLERHSPVTKTSGLFYFGNLGLARPEIVRYRNLVKDRYSPPEKAQTLLLLPTPSTKPFHRAKELRKLIKKTREARPSEKLGLIHVCFYCAPFGVVPLELDEAYPLSQHKIALPMDSETKTSVAEHVKEYLRVHAYKKIVLAETPSWEGQVSKACLQVEKKDLSTTVLQVIGLSNEKDLDRIAGIIGEICRLGR